MVRVSKTPLPPDVRRKIDDQFVELFTSCKSKKEIGHILNELLGDEEKTVLVKRLAAVAMLGNGHSSYEVQQTLHIGVGTALRVREQLNEHAFPRLEKMLCSSRGRQHTEANKLIEILFYAGMPPFEGKGRRKWQQKMRAGRK